jgi:phosphoribosylformylglycinamidine synthase
MTGPWVPTPEGGGNGRRFRRSARLKRCKALIGSPNHAHKAWVWEQYDTRSGRYGGGCRVWRGRGAGAWHAKALAFTSDVTPRYVKANPL